MLPQRSANSPLQRAKNLVSSFELPASLSDFGKEEQGNFADKYARGWYYDGEASRPFHRLTPAVLAASLHVFIDLSETSIARETDLAPGASKSKGLPHLPPDLDWPDGALFLAQFNMADLHTQDVEKMLPAEGILYFFFNPNTAEGSARFYTGPIEKLSLRSYPETGSDELRHYHRQYRDRRYQITFHKKAAFCIDEVLEHLPDKLVGEVSALLDCPITQRAIGENLFGEPGYWQGENELTGGREIAEEADLLLLQYEFGEGHIHFWIAADALRQRDFSRVWMSYSGT